LSEKNIRPDTPEMRRAIEAAFKKPVVGVTREVSPYSSSFPIENLEIAFADGEMIDAVLKDLSPEAMLEGARRIRPASFEEAERETAVYRTLLSSLDLGWPKRYGESVDRDAGRYWLFLEHVAAPLLSEIGEFASWLETARWLARFHSALDETAATVAAPQLLKYDAARYWDRLNRASKAVGPILDPIVSGYGRVVEVLTALPRTFIHGEFYPSNVLVKKLEDGLVRICPVDWEAAGVGPGFLDIAALASGKWERDQRLQLLEAYVQTLPQRMRPQDPVQVFDSCQLQAALQWIGWAEQWTPPAAHAHDWIDEALRISCQESIAAFFQ
jgi:hypothetical protein